MSDWWLPEPCSHAAHGQHAHAQVSATWLSTSCGCIINLVPTTTAPAPPNPQAVQIGKQSAARWAHTNTNAPVCTVKSHSSCLVPTPNSPCTPRHQHSYTIFGASATQASDVSDWTLTPALAQHYEHNTRQCKQPPLAAQFAAVCRTIANSTALSSTDHGIRLAVLTATAS